MCTFDTTRGLFISTKNRHYLNASWDQFEMMPSMSLYHLYKDVVDPQKTRTGRPADWNYKLLEKHKEHVSWMEILQVGWGYIFSWKRWMYEWKWEKPYQKIQEAKASSFFTINAALQCCFLENWHLLVHLSGKFRNLIVRHLSSIDSSF